MAPTRALSGMYAIIDAALTSDPERLLVAILRGGIRLVQYRAKAGIDRAVVRTLHRRTRSAAALLIVNDDEGAALDADGLHVGQEDLAVTAPGLRRRLGSRILGVSCGEPSEVPAALALGADYIGVGPFAITSSKADAGPAIGGAGVVRVVAVAGHVPVAAIGGVALDNLAAVAATGARMAVVLSALATSGDPETTAREFVGRWNARAV